MDDYTADDVSRALKPVESLIGKSEKAQRRLAPGTWQHTMLGDNLRALRIAHALMSERVDGAHAPSEAELSDALGAFDSMIARARDAKTKFAPGTPQHSLQRNRLEALRLARALTENAARDLERHGHT